MSASQDQFADPFAAVEEVVNGMPTRVYERRLRSLRELFDLSCARNGDRTHIVFGSERLTFADVSSRVAHVAAGLADRGVGHGSRVAVLAANHPAWAETLWATTRLGGVVVGLNGWWAPDELEYALRDSAPTVLVVDQRRLERIAHLLTDGSLVQHVLVVDGTGKEDGATEAFAALFDGRRDDSVHEVAEDDPAVILYTSGTTGRSKGAVWTHRSMIAALQSHAHRLALGRGPRPGSGLASGTAGSCAGSSSASGSAGATGAPGPGSGSAGATGAPGPGSGSAGATGAPGPGSGSAGATGAPGPGSGSAGSSASSGAAGSGAAGSGAAGSGPASSGSGSEGAAVSGPGSAGAAGSGSAASGPAGPGSSTAPGVAKPARPQMALLISVPMFHTSGLHAGIVTAMATGGKAVILEGRFRPEEVLRLIQDEGVVAWAAVPTMVLRVIEHPDFGRYDVSSLKSISYGGSPSSADLQERARDAFGLAVKLGNSYGLTETTSAIMVVEGDDFARRPDSVGRPNPLLDVKIVDESGASVPVGQRGEIAVRGAVVTPGYWRNPEATAAVIKDGWFHTGDIGEMDAEGYVYIRDRAKDMIIRGGENVYCAEIEDRLEQHPAVAEAAIVGAPHPELGEEVKAIVRLEEGLSLTDAELKAWAAETLARFKVPSLVEFTAEPLPRTPSGKILKTVLRGDRTAPPPSASTTDAPARPPPAPLSASTTDAPAPRPRRSGGQRSACRGPLSSRRAEPGREPGVAKALWRDSARAATDENRRQSALEAPAGRTRKTLR